MPTETVSNKATTVSRFATLIAALTALPDANTIPLGGTTHTKSDLLAVLNAYVTAHQTTTAARQSFSVAVTAERASLEKAQPLRALLKTYLQGRLGKTSPAMAQYGFEPAKVPKLRVAQKATGIARTAATRAARHTMGSKQKAEVKGTVTTIVVPTASQPSTTPPATPASSPSTAPAAVPASSSTGSTPHVA